MSLAAALKKMFTRAYTSVPPQRAAELAEGGAILLDVREPQEWRAGHAPKARHIPLGQLSARLGELPQGRPVIIACRSGSRSARAAAMLAGQGRETFNLSGGMHAWARAGLPLRAKGGAPGRVI